MNETIVRFNNSSSSSGVKVRRNPGQGNQIIGNQVLDFIQAQVDTWLWLLIDQAETPL